MNPENFIEVSYEVANKVGGIYQVLKSKSSKMDEYYGDGYLTIGPYNEENAEEDFVPRETPEKLEQIFEDLEERGIECHYGVWRVSGSPRCILVDASGMEKDIDSVKSELWENHGIDSMSAGPEFDNSLRWSHAVGMLIDRLEDQEDKTVVQLHEWLSGPAMFEFDSPAVFTTHATVLGRTLSSSDFDLQTAVEDGEVDQSLAAEHGVGPKHGVERASAENAEAFTTVSETTAEEAEAVLGVEPDKVLPNGFNVSEFPSLEELSYQHRKKKDQMKEFLQAYFEPYYDIDLEDDPRILFISGRYEFHNKGLDTFIDALADLNSMEGDEFFVFFFVPTDVGGVKPEVLENMSLYQEMEDYVESIMPEIRTTLLNSITSERDPGEELKNLVDETSFEVESLRSNFHQKRDKTPPKSAFDLRYASDEILDRMHRKGLRNREEDRVKVVFYPTYLSMGDKLLSMSYNDAIVACSAGIFPSYYEPWGYTPVETAANGALSITTDMAGFGKFLLQETDTDDRKGIRVLRRRNVDDQEAVSNLADMIDEIVSYSKTQITERKHNARRLAQLTSWEKLAENYREAHRMAVEE